MIVEKNRVVSIEYILTSSSGEVLDRSDDGKTLDYLHGGGNVIPGLEQELEGKKAGDSLSVSVKPELGYGLYDDGLVMNMSRDKFETEEELREGMEFAGQTEDGEYHIFRVVSVKGGKIKVDGNHPLAGQKLHFDVTIKDVREATDEELAHGHVHGDEDDDCGCDCENDGAGCGGGCCGN